MARWSLQECIIAADLPRILVPIPKREEVDEEIRSTVLLLEYLDVGDKTV